MSFGNGGEGSSETRNGTDRHDEERNMNATLERQRIKARTNFVTPLFYVESIDAQAEREGIAMRRHRKLTAKHRRIVYRNAGIADPRP